jgi:hypothetical protein
MTKLDMLEILDTLRERGYEPQDAPYADLFELIASGMGSVRVVAYRDSEPHLRVVALDKFVVHRWSLRIGPDTPLAVFLAVLDAAEAELSALAGRKITA